MSAFLKTTGSSPQVQSQAWFKSECSAKRVCIRSYFDRRTIKVGAVATLRRNNNLQASRILDLVDRIPGLDLRIFHPLYRQEPRIRSTRSYSQTHYTRVIIRLSRPQPNSFSGSSGSLKLPDKPVFIAVAGLVKCFPDFSQR